MSTKTEVSFLQAEMGTLGKAEAEWVSALLKHFPEVKSLRENVASATRQGLEKSQAAQTARVYNSAGWFRRWIRRVAGKPATIDVPEVVGFQSECLTAFTVTRCDWVGVGLAHLEA